MLKRFYVNEMADTMVAFASYTPMHSDEMGLSVGDIVSLFQCYDDGWAFAINQATKRMGFVPRNFLQPYMSDDKGVFLNGSTSEAPNRISSMVVSNPNEVVSSIYSKSGNSPSFNTGNNITSLTSPISNNKDHNKYKIQHEGTPDSRLLPIVRKVSRIPTASEAQNRLKEIEISRKLRARPATTFGKFRIQVAGDSGIGKTTLVKQLLSSGEILISEPPIFIPAKSLHNIHIPLVEYRASTLHPVSVYPEEDRFNINLIDTPGYSASVDAGGIIDAVTGYCEAQFETTVSLFSDKISSTQLFRFLSGSSGAHSHIDVCLYCLLHRVTECDIKYMRHLSEFVTVIPVFIKSDTMTRDEAFAAKKNLVKQLDEEKISFFGFGLTPEEMIVLADSKVEGAPPLVVSSRQEIYKSSMKSNRMQMQEESNCFRSDKMPNPQLDSPYNTPQICHQNRPRSSGDRITPIDLEPDGNLIPSDYKPPASCLNELRVLKLALMHYHADDLRRSTSLKYLFWKKKKY